MRIIAKRHDYYDRGMGLGQDMSSVFLRAPQECIPTKEIMAAQEFSLEMSDRISRNVAFSFSLFMVAFCGKTYAGIHVTESKIDEKGMVLAIIGTACFYDFARLKEYFVAMGLNLPEPSYLLRNNKRTENMLKEYFAQQGSNKITQFLIKERIVVMTLRQNGSAFFYPTDILRAKFTCINNDNLEKFEFYRVFDAFGAYQEIDMYVSGTLPQSTAMPINITDKDRIAQHGFDRYSFRKSAEK